MARNRLPRREHRGRKRPGQRLPPPREEGVKPPCHPRGLTLVSARFSGPGDAGRLQHAPSKSKEDHMFVTPAFAQAAGGGAGAAGGLSASCRSS